MNKAELIEAIAKDTSLSKTDIDAVLKSFMAQTVKAAKKDSVTLVGFGTFKVIKTKARNGVNPSTGEKIKIKAGKKFKFSASKTLTL